MELFYRNLDDKSASVCDDATRSQMHIWTYFFRSDVLQVLEGHDVA